MGSSQSQEARANYKRKLVFSSVEYLSSSEKKKKVWKKYIPMKILLDWEEYVGYRNKEKTEVINAKVQ